MAKILFRITALSVAMLCSVLSPAVHALGLGEIEIQSALNDPLKAVITLTSGTPEELKDLKISIAPREAFERAGISRPTILRDFQFTIDQTQKNRPVIRVSTREAVREPFLVFLVEATWPRGRLLRQYTVLVDPPVTIPAQPPVPKIPVTAPPPPATATVTAPPEPQRRQPVRPAPQPASVPAAAPQRESADTYGPVRRSETLWSIAQQLRPEDSISSEQMMLALLRTNPDAFLNDNINNLKAGAVLRIPTREEITAWSQAEARSEVRRQHAEWKAARSAAREPESSSATKPATEPEPASGAAATETRLQLVAPEDKSTETAATTGTAESDTGTAEPAGDLHQQLALATEEAQAGRAIAGELQSRVGELEEQVAGMQRLLELKDEQLARLQNRLADDTAESQSGADEAVPAATVAQDAAEPTAQAPEDSGTAPPAEPAAPEPVQPENIIDHLINNPVLSGLGVVVAMILGGILWSSTRQRRHADMFSDEPTLASQLATLREQEEPAATRVAVSESPQPAVPDEHYMSPVHVEGESDPLTEADVFIAYGRVQQAEDVLQAALKKDPNNMELKAKLLEVYHAAGNLAAFDTQAEGFHRSVDESDPLWQKVAIMGYELSPDNRLYKAAAGQESGVDFDMDLSGMDALDQESLPEETHADGEVQSEYPEEKPRQEDLAETVEFNLDETGGPEEESGEELLDTSDEVGTKLDLARAYLDMGDPEGARSILEEVLEEGDDNQKREAEDLFAQLA
ncbi:MAG: FimV/HubP family polar landmark protein [Gammaproteobacteria bacterium]